MVPVAKAMSFKWRFLAPQMRDCTPLGGLHTTSMPCTSSCWGTPNPWAHCLGATAFVTTAHLCSTCLAGWAPNMQPKPAQHLAASCRLGHAILSARLSASTCHLRQGAPHQPISCFTHQCPNSKKGASLWAPGPGPAKALPTQACPPMPRAPLGGTFACLAAFGWGGEALGPFQCWPAMQPTCWATAPKAAFLAQLARPPHQLCFSGGVAKHLIRL